MVEGGVRLRLRLTPKSSKDRLGDVEALSDGSEVLKAYVRAVPEDGKANAALLKVLTAALGLPKSSVELESGATSRIKVFLLRGPSGEISRKLAEFVQVQQKSQ